MIPKLNKPFTIEGARESMTLRFSDGDVEHVQSDIAAYLWAACDALDQAQRELGAAQRERDVTKAVVQDTAKACEEVLATSAQENQRLRAALNDVALRVAAYMPAGNSKPAMQSADREMSADTTTEPE